VKRIKLTQQKYAVVSDVDFPALNRVKWSAHYDGYNWYARRRKPGPRNQNNHLLMHRELLHCSKTQEIDHKNGNGLDNRRSNLRKVTHQQNVRNRTGPINKGVSKIGNKFRARISLDGEKQHIGIFDTQQQAIRAYQQRAKKYFGKFVRKI